MNFAKAPAFVHAEVPVASHANEKQGPHKTPTPSVKSAWTAHHSQASVRSKASPGSPLSSSITTTASQRAKSEGTPLPYMEPYRSQASVHTSPSSITTASSLGEGTPFPYRPCDFPMISRPYPLPELDGDMEPDDSSGSEETERAEPPDVASSPALSVLSMGSCRLSVHH